MRAPLDRDVMVKNCQHCGGLHYGSNGCPYNETVCDICHKTLLQHPELCFCEGGKTEHNPRQKYCTCETCVTERMKFWRRVRRGRATPEGERNTR